MSDWHLEYNCDVDEQNRIVREKIFGIWKEDVARSYKADFEASVKDLLKSKKPWVKIVDLSNWKAASPEAIDIIGRHLAWCRENNMAWSVNIVSNPTTYRQLHQMFARGGTRKISKTFRSRTEGEAFLAGKGFSVNGNGNAGGGAASLFRF